jgi:rare lipoprotein A
MRAAKPVQLQATPLANALCGQAAGRKPYCRHLKVDAREIRNNIGFGVRQRFMTLAGSTVICAMSIFAISDAQARTRAHVQQAAAWTQSDEADGETDRATETGSALQSGNASWYGPGFHGRRTASGETFNQNALTAAHKSLPFGTRVRVVNQQTGGSVVVRINDRGPFVRGRVIDLTPAGARALGFSGLTQVTLAVGG